MFREFSFGRATAIVAAIAFGLSIPAYAQQPGGGYGGYGGYGMMGPGMMGGYGAGAGMMYGGGAFNRPVYPGWGGNVLDAGQVSAYLQEGDEIGRAEPKTNTVTYSGKEVLIDLVAVQPGHEDQTFEVHGLANPTLVVPLGATVHLNLVNMDYGDNMEHGIILTPAPPPYPYMSMMATGPGVAGVMPLLPWRSSKTIKEARYAGRGATFVARERGTYWYVCPTPNHAEQGMFGKFVVQ